MASFPKLSGVLTEINQIDDQKLSQLATRTAQHIALRGNSGELPFTPEERLKLEASLELNKTQVSDVISAIAEVLRDAAYHGMSTDVLAHRLSSTDLEGTKTTVLTAVWGKAMTAVTQALSNSSVLPQISFIGYDLSTSGGSDAAVSDVRDPSSLRGILQIGLEHHSHSETLLTEFSHDQLSEFHGQLNRIQAQLNAIADK